MLRQQLNLCWIMVEPARPNNQFVFELFEYGSANSGSFRGQDRFYESVEVNGSYIECEVIETFALSLVKDGDAGDLMVDMVSDREIYRQLQRV